MKIAYLVSRYPDVSHTFILREVRALRALGVEIRTFSVRRPSDRNVLGSDAQQEAATTEWLVPARAGRLLLAFAWFLSTRPVLAIRTLLSAVLHRGLTVGDRIKWLFYFGEAVLLARQLVTGEFSHLHCHFGNSGSSTAMLAAQLAGIPFSMTCHGSELLEPRKHRLSEKVSRACFVACVSTYGKAQLMLASRPADWSKLHVVRCGVLPQFQSATPLQNGLPMILCVARLSPEKGHLILLDALAKLRNARLDFKCMLVGDGPLRARIQNRIIQLALALEVTLAGAVAADRVAQLYSEAEVVVLSSFSEGVPVVLMEAMACRRPVVATSVGGVPELVKHEVNGLLVAPGDSSAMADALRRVLTDAPLARDLGRNGARWVDEQFNLERSARQLLELFGQAGVPGPSAGTQTRYDLKPCLTYPSSQNS